MSDFEARGRHLRLPAEVRAAGDTITVEGYAAVFDQETEIGPWFRERIARGAFVDAIGRDDVVFLINHDGLPLARTRSETLELREDAKGLWMRSELDAGDPDVQRIAGKMRRGDLDRMSFAFWPEAERWEDLDEDMPLRIIDRARLHDVSIVTTPAYEGTEIGLRSLKAAQRDRRQANFSATQLRLLLKGNLELRARENG